MRGAQFRKEEQGGETTKHRLLFAAFEARLGMLPSEVPKIDLTSAVIGSREIASDHQIWEDMDERQSLYLIDEGFAYRFTHLTGGKRHIDDFFGPGTICNWPRLKSADYRCNLVIKGGSRLVVLDPGRVEQVLAEKRNAKAAIERLELARALRVSQRVRALISLPASHRIAVFLLDMREEYRLGGRDDDWLPFRLTQEEIADATGMTEVHVNRTLAKMEQADQLERRRGKFCLPDAKRLEEQLHYRRFLNGYRGDGDG